MVDFIKVMLPVKYQSILEGNSLLNFTQNVNTGTGEISSKSKVAYYKNMKFEICDSGSVFISGSLHKLYNNGKHNYNDFTIDNFLDTVQLLKDKFNINANDCRLRCIEFGINVDLPYEVDKVINYSILHRKVPFEVKYNSAEGNYKQSVHSQYYIKLYNKTKHYKSRFFDVPDDLMRFEIKYRKMQKLNAMGIYLLSDLQRNVFSEFKKALLTEWNNVLFYDFTTQIDHLKEKERLKIQRYDSLNYWNRLIKGTNENYKYHKKQLNQFVVNYSDNVQNEISNLIGCKTDQLIKETTLNDHLYIASNRVVKQLKRCLITNVDISMQKQDSFLLSHSGLWFYYKSDTKLFNRIKNEYLSVKWSNAPIEIQIREISHNIRNKINNSRIKNANYYRPMQYSFIQDLEI